MTRVGGTRLQVCVMFALFDRTALHSNYNRPALTLLSRVRSALWYRLCRSAPTCQASRRAVGAAVGEAGATPATRPTLPTRRPTTAGAAGGSTRRPGGADMAGRQGGYCALGACRWGKVPRRCQGGQLWGMWAGLMKAGKGLRRGRGRSQGARACSAGLGLALPGWLIIAAAAWRFVRVRPLTPRDMI